MKRVALLFVTVAALLPAAVSAKGPVVRVTISGGRLAAPVVVADAAALRPFNVWAGAGVTVGGVPQTTGFIVDWTTGPVAEPPAALARYEVRFHIEERNGAEPVYVVSYAFDAARVQGYVYLPVNAANMQLIRRGVEGHWFPASKAWDQFYVSRF